MQDEEDNLRLLPRSLKDDRMRRRRSQVAHRHMSTSANERKPLILSPQGDNLESDVLFSVFLKTLTKFPVALACLEHSILNIADSISPFASSSSECAKMKRHLVL
uniref:Uncharacterized protein n=1 Tax=Caenorhabditis tropicalis TaxID=1561998 RepID=A0A1I7UA44_9PELO